MTSAVPPDPPALHALPLRDAGGQASVELVVLLPVLAVVLALAWQGVLAAQALWAVNVAARAAARAAAVAAPPVAAARAHLPADLERGLRVRAGGAAGEVRVTVTIPTVVRGIDLGTVSATGRFAPQSG
jgi:hypothetical protein